MCTDTKVIGELLQNEKMRVGDEDLTLTEYDTNIILAWEEQRALILSRAVEPCNDAARWRLADERHSITHHFRIFVSEEETVSGYLTVGMFPSGRVAEVFVRISKEGSLVSGAIDGFCTVLSIALQHGISLGVFLDKMLYTRFEPAGTVLQPVPGMFQGEMQTTHSVLDYIARYLKLRFPDGYFMAGGKTNQLRQLL